MTAVYYNDNDPFVCGWLENLIRDRQIPAGDVDDRDIREVTADDLKPYDTVHLFAGIGGWAYALDLARWDPARPVWTCSCPCPPFSQAGRKKTCPQCESTALVWNPRRSGYAVCADCTHAWVADDRHLWPDAWRLITECHAPVVFGEQVSGSDGEEWYAGVRASLEIAGYAVGSEDLPASLVGAPQRRQRLYWVADTDDGGWQPRESNPGSRRQHPAESGSVRPRRMGDAEGTRGARGRRVQGRSAVRPGGARTVAGSQHGNRRAVDRSQPESPAGRRTGQRDARPPGAPGRMGDTHGAETERQRSDRVPVLPDEATGRHRLPSPWSRFRIVPCRGEDGRIRYRRVPVEPEFFPLAAGVPARVGRLRGYGNSIVPQVAALFIRVYVAAREPHEPDG